MPQPLKKICFITVDLCEDDDNFLAHFVRVDYPDILSFITFFTEEYNEIGINGTFINDVMQGRGVLIFVTLSER